MRKKTITNILKALFLLFIAVNVSFAANKYWFGGDGSWSSSSHWSTTSPATLTVAAPGSADIAIYDSNSGAGTCTVDATISVAGINLGSSTITVTQGAFPITIGASNATISAGTFTGGTASITCSGTFTMSGGSFTSTAWRLGLNGASTFTGGTFIIPNGRTVNDTGTATGGSTTTLTNTGKAWTSGAYVGSTLKITGGTNNGQTRFITGNTATVIIVSPAFPAAIDATSVYELSTTPSFYAGATTINGANVTILSEGITTFKSTFALSSGTFTGGTAFITCVGALDMSGGYFTSTTASTTGYLSFTSANFRGGTFNGKDGNIKCTTSLTINGCDFTSTSGNLSIYGPFTYLAGPFNHNSGSLVFWSNGNTNTITPGTARYNHVSFPVYTGNNAWTFVGTLYMEGNLTSSKPAAQIPGPIELTGTTPQSVSSTLATNLELAGVGNLTVNKGSGSVAYLANHFLVTGTLVVSNGSTLNCAVYKLSTPNIINNGTIETGGGTCTIAGGATCNYINNGTFKFTGCSITTINTFTNNGTLEVIGSEPLGNIRIAGLTSGINSLIKYTPTSGMTLTLRNWTYNNLEIKGDATSSCVLSNTTKAFKDITLTSGTFDVSTANSTLTVTGNWKNTGGTFTPGTGRVVVTGTALQTITSGASSFYNLNINNTTSAVTFADGATILGTFAVTNAPATINFKETATYAITNLTMTGYAGNNVNLRSSTSPTPWTISVAGAQNLSYVDVMDSTATSTMTATNNCTDSGNNTLWYFGDVVSLDRYWVGTVGGNWSTGSNWSTISGGTDAAGAPDNTQTAIFDNNSGTGICTIEADINIGKLNMKSTTNAVLYQGASNITIGLKTDFAGGTFIGGSGNIVNNGALTISGSSFTSTLGTLFANNAFTVSSTSFTHNNGTVEVGISGTSFTPGTAVYNTVRLSNTSARVLAGTLNLEGNLYNVSTGGFSGTGTVQFVGTSASTITASAAMQNIGTPVFVLNKTGSSVLLGSNFAFNDVVIINTGSTFDLNATTLTATMNSHFTNNGTVIAGDGTVRFYSTSGAVVSLSPGTSVYNNVMTYNNSTFPATAYFNITGTLYIDGNFTFESLGAVKSGGMVLTGTKNQTIGFLNSSGNYAVASPLTINKASGEIVLNQRVFFGAVTIENLSSLNLAGFTFSIQKDYTNNAAALSISSTGTVRFGLYNDVGTMAETNSVITPGNTMYPNITAGMNAGIIKTISGTLSITGNFAQQYRGTFTVGNIVFNGTTNQTIYQDQKDYGMNSPVIINNSTGTVVVSSGGVNSGCNLSICTINAGSIFNVNGYYYWGGTTVNNGTFTTGTGGVTCTLKGTTFTNNGTVKLAGNEPTATTTSSTTVVNITTFNSGAGSLVQYTNPTGTSTFTLPGWWNYSNLEIAGSTNTFVLTNTTKAFNSVTLTSGAFDASSGNTLLTVTGNWTNAGGTFAPGTGKAVFAGTALQTVQAGVSPFYDINIINTAAPVIFADSLTAVNFVDTTGDSGIKFSTAPSVFTITNITITGTFGHNVTLTSVTNGSPWSLKVSGNQSISYVSVMDSNASTSSSQITATNNCTDLGGNTNWRFTDIFVHTALVVDYASQSGNADNSAKVTLFKITITCNSAADNNIELQSLNVKLTSGAGANLTTPDAQALFENILLVADNLSLGTASTYQSVFDTDNLKSISNGDITISGSGYLNIPVATGTAYSTIVKGVPSVYFLVGEIKSNANTATLNNFKGTIDADTDLGIGDVVTHVPQSLNSTVPVSSTVLTAIAPASALNSNYPKTLASGESISEPAYNRATETELYVGGATGKLYALNADGTSRWTLDTGVASPLSTSPRVVVETAGTFIYAANDSGVIFKIQDQGASGTTAWTLNLGAAVISEPIINSVDKTMYVGAGDKLYKLDISSTTPSTIWSRATTPSGNLNSVSVYESYNNCWIGSESGSFYYINSFSGDIISSLPTGAAIKSSPFLDAGWATPSNNLFITSTDGKLYCVSSTNLTVSPWTPNYYDTLNSVSTTPFVDQADNAVYFGTDNGKMYRLQASTGTPAWQVQTGVADGSISIKSSPIVYNGTVYFGSDDGKCYALNTSDGSLKSKWPVTTGAEIKAMPVLGGWDGNNYTNIAFTSKDGKVYVLQIP